jgi:hypothetical protein
MLVKGFENPDSSGTLEAILSELPMRHADSIANGEAFEPNKNWVFSMADAAGGEVQIAGNVRARFNSLLEIGIARGG